MAKRNLQFQTIRTEGAILPPDILRRIASLKVEGATPDAYHLPPGNKLNEAISQSWTSLLNHWQAFQEARGKLTGDGETGTAVTNECWLLPLFNELDYGRLVTTKSPVIDERSYPIERFYNHTPIHLIGCKLPLDRRTKGARGAATASPHSMVQEFLNCSDEHVWAFLSNGLQLRIMRDNVSLSRQAFVEFDLEAMMEGEVYADFALLWLLCHQSRVEAEKPEECWLEQWSKLAREQGTRVLNDLRVGVAKSIEALGRGFIGHPRNDHLREKLHSGTLTKDEFYRQLLRIVYRLLFLFVAEDRELLHSPDASTDACELYDAHYSTRRLRELALKMRGTKHADLWHALSLVFDALGKKDGCPQLGLSALGSFLWRASSTADLIGPHQANGEAVFITNDDLLEAVRALAYVEQDRVLRMVDYRNLGSEELGSVYESLLELHPVMDVDGKSFDLMTAAGNERKMTGSYYTPDSLVQCLLDSALDPVVEERLKGKKGEDAEQAILGINICDPASGSGHFLIAAAHRLARHLARTRTGESEPSPEDYQHSLRDVIGRCLYGVDINPMAVELCKVSLWMEAIEPGKPLSFLDHHIQCGNSLLGTTPALLAKGIPNDAFQQIDGDDKSICSDMKKSNKRERQEYASGQGYLFSTPVKLGNLPATLANINRADDETLSDITAKEDMYAQLVRGADYRSARLLADTWCAAFVWEKANTDLGRLCPTERTFRSIEDNPHSINIHVKAEVERLARQYHLFHWHLAFPDVFRLPAEAEAAENDQTGWNGGFDVVLGNPPWDKVQPEEQKFFAASRQDIAAASTGSKRKKMIAALEKEDHTLFASWCDYKRQVDGSSHLLKTSRCLQLTTRGNLNLYRLFGELASITISEQGRAGMVLQTGLATDQTSKEFLDSLLSNNQLVQFLDFENRSRFFADVDIRFRFALVTMKGASAAEYPQPCCFGWLLQSMAELSDAGRLVPMTSKELRFFNPNSSTAPTFTSQRDFRINLRLYKSGHYLNAGDEGKLGDIAFQGEIYNMTRDSSLFVPHEQNNGESLLPLYEAKNFHQLDHRYASVVSSGEVADVESTQKTNPDFCITSRYYVDRDDTVARVRKQGIAMEWLVGFRSVSSGTNERTAIFSAFPLAGAGNSINVVLGLLPAQYVILLGNGNAFVFDYACRQKMSGMNVNIWIMEQLPVIPEERYSEHLCAATTLGSWITARVLELSYTAWDLEAIARDTGYNGPPFRWDDERRFLMRCELDAAYFHLYLGDASNWGSDGPELAEMFPTPRCAVDYIMDTFPIVKRKDEEACGEYRTKRVILEIYDAMAEAMRSGKPYQTRLDPAPGPPTDSKGNYIPTCNWEQVNWPSHIHQPREVRT